MRRVLNTLLNCRPPLSVHSFVIVVSLLLLRCGLVVVASLLVCSKDGGKASRVAVAGGDGDGGDGGRWPNGSASFDRYAASSVVGHCSQCSSLILKHHSRLDLGVWV
jgi:hypothetical protein